KLLDRQWLDGGTALTPAWVWLADCSTYKPGVGRIEKKGLAPPPPKVRMSAMGIFPLRRTLDSVARGVRGILLFPPLGQRVTYGWNHAQHNRPHQRPDGVRRVVALRGVPPLHATDPLRDAAEQGAHPLGDGGAHGHALRVERPAHALRAQQADRLEQHSR